MRRSRSPFLFCAALVAACGGGSTQPPLTPDGATPSPDAGRPDADQTPTTLADGLYPLESTRWTDLGEAAPGDPVRLVIALSLRDQGRLEERVTAMYDPSSPSFRAYALIDELLEHHAPPVEALERVEGWLAGHGLTVTFRAGNRLLLCASGTAAAFRSAFGVPLHVLGEVDSEQRAYGAAGALTVPAWIAPDLAAVLTADLPADPGPLPGETGEITTAPPPADLFAFRPAEIARAYGASALHGAGFAGQGVRLGIVAGAGFKRLDVQSFWRSFGLERADPLVVTTMEPIATRYLETTLDVEWAGALAPGAELVVFEGPDARDSSLVYTFNEAVARGEVDVLTDSFAHHEASVTRAVREQYDRSALWAAALGVTVVAAAGNSTVPDVPGTSPWVTAVGGTMLYLDDAGAVTDEVAWPETGSGESLSFAAPPWQAAMAESGRRCVADVALNAGRPYWVYRYGLWERWRGTSFAAPVLAGLVASADSRRLAEGRPALGWLNGLLYLDTAARGGFRDVVSGTTPEHPALPGWDFPSGWGAPDAAALAGAR